MVVANTDLACLGRTEPPFRSRQRIPWVGILKREHWPEWGAGLVFIASSVAMLATAFGGLPLPLLHQLHQLHKFKFFDLRVYRRAALVVREGRPLYTAKLRHGLGFTYPPFAVLLFLPLRALTARGDEIAVTLANLGLTAVVARAATRLGDGRSAGGQSAGDRGVGRSTTGDPRRRLRRRRAAAWLAAAVAVWSEPIATTIGYGQIDLLIAALVVVDLAYGRRSRLGGLGIGAAAALKLTPLIFIPYLALSRRRGMAARASAAFALSVAVAFAAVPGDAWSYWVQGSFMKLSRITGAHRFAGSSAANQSLRGALLRLFPHLADPTLIWLLLALAVGVLGLLVAVRASRRSEEALGFALTAVTALLISPVSWTHHWAIAIAATVAVIGSSRSLATGLIGALVAAAVWVGASAMWTVIALGPGARLTPGQLLLGDLYVLIGLAAIFGAATAEALLSVRRRSRAQVAGVELAAVAGAQQLL